MTGKRSRSKGKRGELQACQAWGALGFPAQRGYQFRGGKGTADIEFEEPAVRELLHTEVKHVEKLNVRAAFEQAERDALGRTPLLMHRRNHTPWLVTLRLEDLAGFLREMWGGAGDLRR